jgi:membrane protein implicated in regulation of membrane protease activity
MNAESRARSRAEVVDEVSKWTVGLGILGVALAPLALPIIVLTAAALLPLLVVPLALAIVAAPVLLVRGLVRRVRQRRESSSSRSESRFMPRSRAASAAPR